jgi:hypothetical protein
MPWLWLTWGMTAGVARHQVNATGMMPSPGHTAATPPPWSLLLLLLLLLLADF